MYNFLILFTYELRLTFRDRHVSLPRFRLPQDSFSSELFSLVDFVHPPGTRVLGLVQVSEESVRILRFGAEEATVMYAFNLKFLRIYIASVRFYVISFHCLTIKSFGASNIHFFSHIAIFLNKLEKVNNHLPIGLYYLELNWHWLIYVHGFTGSKYIVRMSVAVCSYSYHLLITQAISYSPGTDVLLSPNTECFIYHNAHIQRFRYSSKFQLRWHPFLLPPCFWPY